MKKSVYLKASVAILIAGFFSLAFSTSAFAWCEHEWILFPLLMNMPEVKNAPDVKAESIESFLASVGKGLEKALATEEAWDRKNIKHYKPLPSGIAFSPGGDSGKLLKRFEDAIRISDRTIFIQCIKMPPGSRDVKGKTISPYDVTFIKTMYEVKNNIYVPVNDGDMVKAIDVLGTASDEPDMGMDVGLFEDNRTEQGKRLGLGKQPYGNPKDEYPGAEPFHMAFYKEAGISYMFAPILKENYIEYRVHMAMTLSEYAFRTGHDYWGWRFMGWGLHYIVDLCMSYHAVVMAELGTSRMLWYYIKGAMGSPADIDNAIQLISNRHIAFEEFQMEYVDEIYRKGGPDNAFFSEMKACKSAGMYNDASLKEELSEISARKAKSADKIIRESLPARYVTDPKIDVDFKYAEGILDATRKEKGREAVDRMANMLREMLAPICPYTKSYIETILINAGRK